VDACVGSDTGGTTGVDSCGSSDSEGPGVGSGVGSVPGTDTVGCDG
jgi:hypothetical protein